MQQQARKDTGGRFAKVFANSPFLDVSTCLDTLYDRLPHDEHKAYADLAVAALKQAMMDAEVEASRTPDRIGRDQQLIFDAAKTGSNIGLFCEAIRLDPDSFSSACSFVLDRIADAARAERQRQSAQVIPISRARHIRRSSRPIQAPWRDLIVLVEKGRFAGQYALAL